MNKNIQRLVAILLSIVLVCGLVGCAGNQKGSAYELAVKNGYTGTELEWLASLAGEVGADGASAYELAVKNGYTGTEAQWLDSLVGETGKDGVSYCHRGGICLETQFYPDSVNHPEWPQPFVAANQPFHSETKYIFR